MHSHLENRFRAILEQSPFSIQIMSPDGYILQVNKAWEELFGVTLEQIEGYNILEDEQLVRKGIMPYIRLGFEGKAAEIPPVLYDPNETIPDVSRHSNAQRWTKSLIYPIKDSDGNLREVVLMHEDITERRIAEEALRISESRYRSLLENATDIIYSHDLKGNYLSINRAGEKITGYTTGEVLEGMNISQIIVPEHLEMAKQMTAKKLQDEDPTIYEVDIFAKDGRRLTLEVSSRISYEDGKPVAVEGVARDVTERKRSEEEKARLAKQIDKQKKHLQEMVATVPGVVWEAWGEPDVANQRIDFVSDYVETMLGYSVEEWLSTPNFWLNIVHPEDREKAARTAAETFAGRSSGVNRFRWLTKEGRALWVEAQSVAIYDEAGNPVGMRGVTMDISERRQKEVNEKFLADASTALAASLDYETTLKSVAQLAVPHFADWCSIDMADEDGTLNRLAVAHVDPKKVAWAEEMHREYAPNLNEPQGVYQVLRTGASEFYPEITDELLVQGARDEKHLETLRNIGFSSAMIVPLKVRGKVLGVLSFVNCESGKHFKNEDLSLAEDLARRAALAIDNARLFRIERETRRAAERTSDFLSRLLEVSTALSEALMPEEVPLAIIQQGVKSLGAYAGVIVKLSDDENRLEMINSVGFPEDVIGRWKDFEVTENVPIADSVRSGRPVLIESMESFHEKYPALGPLASISQSSSLAALPIIVKKKVIGAMGFSFLEPQNFREDDRAFMLALSHQCAQAMERALLYENEQRLRAQAEEASRMKDEFLATVSHELRTPLNAIVGWSNLLVTNKLDPEVSARAIETIKRNATAQAQIIEDLLEVSRIITGKLRLNPDFVELETVIKTALESLQPAIETKNINIKSEFDSETSMFWGDADRLQQIMWNLLSNAIKFTPKGGEIKVKLECNDSQARIVVKDNGQGINKEFLPFVFERFTQADGTTARKYGGLGLGLAIVRHLVEMHGGAIKVDSAGVNKGTTFTVNLPFKAVQVTRNSNDEFLPSIPSDEQPEYYPNFEGARILVVDDEADARFLLTTMIENCGASVTSAGSAPEALKIFKQFKPDVLISDIGMPEEDGYSLIRKVRALDSANGGVPAIALTAYAREEDRLQAERAGFQLHIAKPVKPSELLKAIEKLVNANQS